MGGAGHMETRVMGERLGDVIYWGFCTLAAVLAVGAIWVLIDTGDGRLGFMLFVFAPALTAWLVGRAIRYVLKG